MDKEILSMEDAAELFGVSIKTFIKLLKEEKVPARKIGREWRFSRTALINWLSAGDSQTYSSSEGDAREFFDEVAPEWENISKNYYDESIKNKLVSLQILKKNMTVVDLGCGDGYISRAVAKQVKKVLAVDISSEMLKELKRKSKESGIKNIETLESDGQDISIENAYADIICTNMYLHHIESPEAAIKEMFRIVKPGGMVFLSDFQEHNNNEMMKKMHDIWPGFKLKEIEGWFKNIGFKNIKVEILSNSGESHTKTSESNEKIFVLTAQK